MIELHDSILTMDKCSAVKFIENFKDFITKWRNLYPHINSEIDEEDVVALSFDGSDRNSGLATLIILSLIRKTRLALKLRVPLIQLDIQEASQINSAFNILLIILPENDLFTEGLKREQA